MRSLTPPRLRVRSRRGQAFRPVLELLEDRLPPGDLFWTTSLLSPADGLTPAPAQSTRSDTSQLSLLGDQGPEETSAWDLVVALPTDGLAAPVGDEWIAQGASAPAAQDSLDWLYEAAAPATGVRPLDTAAAAAGYGAVTGQQGGTYQNGGAAVTPAVTTNMAGESLFVAVNSAQVAAPTANGFVPQIAGDGTRAGFDLSIANIEVTQSIQRLNNTIPLVANRPTMVRTYPALTGLASLPSVTGLIYVWENGVEMPGSPFPAMNFITATNTPNRNVESSTVNFLLPPIIGGGFMVPVIYSTTVEEGNYDNNWDIRNLVFDCRNSPSIRYLPTDYRPTGGGENLPPANMMAPGTGDAFVQAAYPLPYPNYAQISGAPLLWTQNINSSTNAYFNALAQRRQMTVPIPDYLYAWLPGNPYGGNGAAQGIPSNIAFGNTDPARFVRTFAHELGHNFGMAHVNRTLAPETGVDVNNQIGLGRIKPSNLNDIMVAGLLTNQAFIDVISYQFVYNRPILQCGAAPGGSPNSPYLFITGLIDEAGNATFHPTYQLLGQTYFTESDPTGSYVLLVHNSTGVQEIRFNAEAHAEIEDGPIGTSFAITIPDDPTITGFTLLREDQLQDRQLRTTNAPVGGFVGLPAFLSGQAMLSWNVADADGDALTVSVQYSADGGLTMTPVVVSATGNEAVIDTNYLETGPNGFLRLIITDGLNTMMVDQPVAVVRS